MSSRSITSVNGGSPASTPILMNRKLLPHRKPRRMKRSQSVREVVAVIPAWSPPAGFMPRTTDHGLDGSSGPDHPITRVPLTALPRRSMLAVSRRYLRCGHACAHPARSHCDPDALAPARVHPSRPHPYKVTPYRCPDPAPTSATVPVTDDPADVRPSPAADARP